MDTYTSKIAEINSKVRKLVSLHDEALLLNVKLKSENTDLKAKLEHQTIILKEMNEKINTIQIAGILKGPEKDTLAIRTRVNELIREVDKCISLLNN